MEREGKGNRGESNIHLLPSAIETIKSSDGLPKDNLSSEEKIKEYLDGIYQQRRRVIINSVAWHTADLEREHSNAMLEEATKKIEDDFNNEFNNEEYGTKHDIKRYAKQLIIDADDSDVFHNPYWYLAALVIIEGDVDTIFKKTKEIFVGAFKTAKEKEELILHLKESRKEILGEDWFKILVKDIKEARSEEWLVEFIKKATIEDIIEHQSLYIAVYTVLEELGKDNKK